MLKKYNYLFLLIIVNSVQLSLAQNSGNSSIWLVKLEEIRSSTSLSNIDKISPTEKLIGDFLNKENPKDSIYARMIHRLGEFYRIEGELEKAVNLFEEAIQINSSNSIYAEPTYLCDTYCNLGLVYMKTDFEKAEEYFEQSFLVFKKFPQKKSYVAAFILEKRAAHYFDIGEYQRAIEIIDVGLSTIPNIRGTVNGGFLDLQKGSAFLELDKLYEAKIVIENAMEILMENGIFGDELAYAYSIYTQLLEKLGDNNKALEILDKSYKLYLLLGYNYKASRNLYSMGNLTSKNDPYKSLTYFFKSLETLGKNDPDKLTSTILNGIGSVYQEIGDYENALKYFQNGLNSLGIGFLEEDILSNPNSTQMKLTTNDQVIFTLLDNKAQTLLELFQAKPENEVYLEAAISTFYLADKAIDQWRWNQKTQVSKVFWRSQTKIMYEKAIESSYLADKPESVFYFIEKSRAVILNDRLSELGAKQFLKSEDHKIEDSLNKQSVILKTKISNLERSDPRYDQSLKDWFETQTYYESFVKSLEVNYPEYYHYKFDTSIVKVEDIQTYVLSRNQIFITYFIGEENIFILKIDKNSMDKRKIPLENFKIKAKELLAIVADKISLNREYPRFLELSNQLYHTLVEPMDILPDHRLIFSPDDMFIPFEILIKDINKPSYFLLNDHPVSYAYSGGFLLKNQNKSNLQKLSLLGIAPVNYSPSLQKTSLFGSDLSLRLISEFFPQMKLLMNSDASKSNFLKYFPEYSIVQLYSHADADSLNIEPSIFFSDDVLKLSDLQFLGNTNTHLIMLSACNTGVGKNIIGEGVFSLARGFASVGIPSSITSLWEVDNLATYAITEQFYKYLSEGHFSDVALQKAKLDYLNLQDKGNRIPYYWGGMILIGNSFQFEDVGNQYPYTLVRILVVLAVLVMIWFFWNKQKKRTINHPSRVKD